MSDNNFLNLLKILLARVSYFVSIFVTLVWFYWEGSFFLTSSSESSSEYIAGIILTLIAGLISISLIKYVLQKSNNKIIDYVIMAMSVLFYLTGLTA